MNPTAIILTILSAIMHSFRNFLTKKSYDKEIFVWWYELFGMLFLLPFFVYFLFQEGIKTSIAVYIGIASGLIHAIYWVLHAKSYEDGDLSHVYPIQRSSPALVLLFAVIFLKEEVTLIGILGILIVASGVYIINMKKIILSELLGPIKAILKERATQFAFLTLISVAVYSIIDKVGVSYTNPLIFSYFFTFFGFIFLTPYIFSIKKKSLIRDEWDKNKRSIVINGFFAVFGYTLILIAFSIEKVSYVVGLRQLSIVFAVLLGSHILKEKHKLIRFSATLLIFIGAFLISIAR